MIIIGYQGIGKSTLSHNSKYFIDLESSCFWYNGQRPDDWYIYYCQIAEHLSEQGYFVFVSSHAVVREFLKDSKEDVMVVCPSVGLKEEWCKRLKDRYEKDHSDKNYKAWKNAEDRYEENIKELLNSGFRCAVIPNTEYDLRSFILTYIFI